FQPASLPTERLSCSSRRVRLFRMPRVLFLEHRAIEVCTPRQEEFYVQILRSCRRVRSQSPGNALPGTCQPADSTQGVQSLGVAPYLMRKQDSMSFDSLGLSASLLRSIKEKGY